MANLRHRKWRIRHELWRTLKDGGAKPRILNCEERIAIDSQRKRGGKGFLEDSRVAEYRR